MRWMIALLIGLSLPQAALAQGQDSSRAERSLQIFAAVFPGLYDNVDQVYFDRRLSLDDNLRVPRRTMRITAMDGPPDRKLFLLETEMAGDAEATKRELARLSTLDRNDLRLQVFALDGAAEDDAAVMAAMAAPPRCSLRVMRSAGHFAGEGEDGCDWRMALAPEELHISREGGTARMYRAREFDCYVDIPGVGGGRDIPYERYDGLRVHDAGGEAWFTTKDEEPRRLGLQLRHVRWPINNYEGVFTRNSLVLYLNEQDPDGKTFTHAYSFTDPAADRLGLNDKWALAYCFMQSNEEIAPFWQ